MKTFIYRALLAVTLCAASAISGLSQTRTIEHDFSPFDGIEATDGFKVSISRNDTYSAKLTIDDALESYVQCYVRSGVLHIGLDSKNVPKDLKKSYKGKNSQGPTLVAVVYLPTLNSLSLDDDCEFFSANNLTTGDFTLTMKGSSSISNLKVVANSATVSLEKNAKFTNANITTEKDLSLSADGKSSVTMEFSCGNLALSGSSNSDIALNGKAEGKVTVAANTSTKIAITGEASSIEVTGKGSSGKVDASALKVDDAVVAITGLTVDVVPAKSLELDLGRGSEVNFSGDPAFKIVKIQNSSVIRK